MPRVRREDGVELAWKERGEGPILVFGTHFMNYPAVFENLLSDLASDHRVVTWDPRGTGDSTRHGPYDVKTEVADLAAVVEAAGSSATLLELFAPRAIVLADARPELLEGVVIMGTAPPLGSGAARPTGSRTLSRDAS